MKGSLEVFRQTSLNEERINRNGQIYDIHVVVKNSPFQLACRMRGVAVNLNKFSHDLKLMYDMEEEKEVSWVKVKPVEYKPLISEDGAQISLEAIKIKVLSSHHEDNFFRLRLTVWDPNNEDYSYTVLSHPIKVISKPLKHRPKQRASGSSPASLLMGFTGEDDDSSPEASPRRPTPGVKRGFQEATRSSARVQQNYTKQQQQLANSSSPMHLNASSSPHLSSTTQFSRVSSSPMNPNMTGIGNNGGGIIGNGPNGINSNSYMDISSMNQKLLTIQEEQRRTNDELNQIKELMQQQLDFDNLFSSKRPKRNSTGDSKDLSAIFSELLAVFSQLESTDALERIRDMLSTMSARDAAQLVELIDILNAAGLNEAHKALYSAPPVPFHSYPGSDLSGNLLPNSMGNHIHTAACATGQCPQKLAADMFYTEVFFDSM